MCAPKMSFFRNSWKKSDSSLAMSIEDRRAIGKMESSVKMVNGPLPARITMETRESLSPLITVVKQKQDCAC